MGTLGLWSPIIWSTNNDTRRRELDVPSQLSALPVQRARPFVSPALEAYAETNGPRNLFIRRPPLQNWNFLLFAFLDGF